jgi:hypothetical protein
MKTWNGRRIYHKTTLQNKKRKREPDRKHHSGVQGLKRHCRSRAYPRIHYRCLLWWYRGTKSQFHQVGTAQPVTFIVARSLVSFREGLENHPRPISASVYGGVAGWNCIADSLIFDALVDGWCHGTKDIISHWTLLSIALDCGGVVEQDDARRQGVILVSGLHRLYIPILEDCHYLLMYIIGRIFCLMVSSLSPVRPPCTCQLRTFP